MRRRALAGVVAVVLLSCGAQANAQLLSFSDWEGLEHDLQAAYVIGAFDSYYSFRAGYVDAANHYARCLRLSEISVGDLVNGIKSVVAAQPAVKDESVPAILIRYLTSYCGPPFKLF